jgi:membrane-bound lytic murein transglycosylase F
MKSKNFSKYLLLWGFVFSLLIAACKNGSLTSPSEVQNDSLIYKVEQKIKDKQKLAFIKEHYFDDKFYRKTKEYFPIIRKYSKRYGIDWHLIIAQIYKESRFNENALSQRGAVGLMQIMPYTAHEITQELDFEFITQDPRENISAGIYHLYKQLAYFPDADYENRIKLALAAYNCGPARVFDAQDIAEYLEGNRNEWGAVRTGLTKLTSADWKLHLEVWEMGVPNYGYFYGYEETIDYVDDIYTNYDLFSKMF